MIILEEKILEPTPKSKKTKETPLRQQDTKSHKVLKNNLIFLLRLRVLVNLWQEKDFSELAEVFNYILVLIRYYSH